MVSILEDTNCTCDTAGETVCLNKDEKIKIKSERERCCAFKLSFSLYFGRQDDTKKKMKQKQKVDFMDSSMEGDAQGLPYSF